jgi:thymidylate synthase (FAD)
MLEPKIIKVLDHGFIQLLDIMGCDHDICCSARVSFGKFGEEKTLAEDENLIRRLMRCGHTSPFEMAVTKWHVKLPLFVARQWNRHRTGTFSQFNETSGRYTEFDDEFFNPKEFRLKSKEDKQGSKDKTIPHDIQCFDKMYTEYQSMINMGIANEMARIVLPLASYTAFVWKIDLHNLLHFLRLRLDSHAQKEIQEYAKVIAGIVKEKFPLTWKAFVDYELESIKFSRQEIQLFKICLNFMEVPMKPDCSYDWNKVKDKLATEIKTHNIQMSKTELSSFIHKMEIINL